MKFSLIRFYLNKEGFSIAEAATGEEALDILENEYIDLAIVDIMMPVMSGETALKNLKEIEGFNTPVIALTADAIAGAHSSMQFQIWHQSEQ